MDIVDSKNIIIITFHSQATIIYKVIGPIQANKEILSTLTKRYDILEFAVARYRKRNDVHDRRHISLFLPTERGVCFCPFRKLKLFFVKNVFLLLICL